MIRARSRAAALIVAVPTSAGVAAQPVPVDVSGMGERGRIVKVVRPEYPAQAEARGVTGVVRIEAMVRPDGYAETYTFKPDKEESVVFVDAVSRVIRGWKFLPLLGDDCYPVPTPFTAEVAFEVDNGKGRIFVTPIGNRRQSPAQLPHQIPLRHEKPYYPWDRSGIGIVATTFAKFTVDREGNVTSAKARSFSPQKPPADHSEVSRAYERLLEDMGPFNRAVELVLMAWKFPPVPSNLPAPWSGCWETRFPEGY